MFHKFDVATTGGHRIQGSGMSGSTVLESRRSLTWYTGPFQCVSVCNVHGDFSVPIATAVVDDKDSHLWYCTIHVLHRDPAKYLMKWVIITDVCGNSILLDNTAFPL